MTLSQPIKPPTYKPYDSEPTYKPYDSQPTYKDSEPTCKAFNLTALALRPCTIVLQ